MIGLGLYTVYSLNSIDEIRDVRTKILNPSSQVADVIQMNANKIAIEINKFRFSKEPELLVNSRAALIAVQKSTQELQNLTDSIGTAYINRQQVNSFVIIASETESSINNLEKATNEFSAKNKDKNEISVKLFSEIISLTGEFATIEGDIHNQSIKDILEAVKQLTLVRLAISDMVESSSPEVHKQCEEKYHSISEILQRIKNGKSPEQLQNKIDRLIQNFQEYKNANIELTASLESFVRASNSSIGLANNLKNQSESFRSECDNQNRQNSKINDEISESIRFSLTTTLTIISILAFFLAGYLVKIITTPIRGGVNTIAASTAQISATVNQLATSSAETASSIAETSTTVDEIRQTAELNARKAKEVSEGSQQASETASSGLEASEAVIRGMDNIRQQMQEISASILLLNEHNQMISEITETVNDLAEQSNLLAVNASIEAAKAGDQGKGFAVVAQEVRNLAEQSKASTKQVRSILSEIQKATNKAVLVTEQGSKAVDKGKNQAEAAIIVIKELSQSINAAALAATGISASSKQQLIGMEEVASSMKVIKEAANQNRISMKQLQDSAVSLKGVSSDISDLIGE
jgi:hypothetical protein